jgi:hypothetical protein
MTTILPNTTVKIPNLAEATESDIIWNSYTQTIEAARSSAMLVSTSKTTRCLYAENQNMMLFTHIFKKNCNTTQNLMQVQTISTTFGLSHINFEHFRESEIS